jgi:2-polyprenyl-3-methyl-5-hydroxy-6-metoxy-1,4-benzoquinol methylase
VALFDPIRSELQRQLSKGDRILDYGCGPGPILAELLKEDGFEVDVYDPYFFESKEVFQNKYQAITCTEAIEHFYKPLEEIDKILKLLEKDGLLILQTQFAQDAKHFETWWYARDPTHVSFFRESTFQWMAKNRHLRIEHCLNPQVNFRNLKA